MVVPAKGLDFDVLAQHVEALSFGQFDVIDKCLVAGRGHEAVGPVALIQQAVQKVGLVVQTEPEDAFFVGFHGKAA